MWTRHLAADVRRPQTNATELDTDNPGVHIQSTKAINHATAKHFRVSQALSIRGKGEDGSIYVNTIGTIMIIILIFFEGTTYELNYVANIAMYTW